MRARLLSFMAIAGLVVASVLPPQPARADVPLLTVTAALTAANQAATLTPMLGESACVSEVSNTFSGTLVFEGIVNATWVGIPATTMAGGGQTFTVSAPGTYTANCSGLKAFRVRASALTSGEADVTINTAQGNSISSYSNVSGTVAISNPGAFPTPIPFPSNQPVTVTNTPGVTVQNFPTPVPVQTVFVSNTPGVTVANTPGVTVQNTPAVSVVNFPTPVPNQNVTVTNTPSVSVVSIPTPAPANATVIQTLGTYVIKSGAGVFYGIANLSGNFDQTTPTNCYDNASTATGKLVSATQLPHNGYLNLDFGVLFTNGLVCNVGLNLLSNGEAVYWK